MLVIRRIPNTEPYGTVIEKPLQYAEKPVETYDYRLKLWKVTSFRVEKTQYIADDFDAVEVGKCRCCKQTIKPYTTKYYQKIYEGGLKSCFLYCADNYYCEDCAKEKAMEDHLTEVSRCIRKTRELRDGEYLETKYFEDGSELYDITEKEKQKITPDL